MSARVEWILAYHWLVMNRNRKIKGCHCGFKADPADCGYGDSVLVHLLELVAKDAS